MIALLIWIIIILILMTLGFYLVDLAAPPERINRLLKILLIIIVIVAILNKMGIVLP